MFPPYCSAFAAGIEAVLSRVFPDSRAAFLPGLALFDGDERSRFEPYAKNLFLVLGLFEGPLSRAAAAIAREGSFRDALRLASDEMARERARGGAGRRETTFRIWTQVDNRNVSPRGLGLEALERAVSSALGLRFSDDAPDRCFYLSERSEGFTLFLMRLAVEKAYEAERGQLAPELASALCAAAGVGPGDVVLDPFAGRGSIPLVAARLCGARAIAGEIEAALLPERPEYERVIGDFLAPGWSCPREPDAIVTDPPWGLFAEMPDRAATYRAIAARFVRLLAPGRVAVVLAANDGSADDLADGGLEREEAWPVLVNGKKALVLRFSRRR